MATYLESLCVALFAVFLLIAVVGDFFCCVILSGLRHLGLFSTSTMEGLALMCTKLTWATAVKCAFWIRTLQCASVTPGAWDEFIADMDAGDAAVKAGAKRQPIFIMSNHLSFLDTLLIVVYTPPRVLWRIRCYMSSHLFNIPLFATICKVLGHFPVYFKKGDDGSFSLDKERMAPVEERVKAHLAGGGILSLFPEGIMNRADDPKHLNTFRHGTFKRALEEDAKIWHLVLYGNNKVWPVKAGIGGMPGDTGMALHPFSPKGSNLKLSQITQGNKEGFKSCETGRTEGFVVLAEDAKAQMQKEFDALSAHVSGSRKKASKGD